MLKICRKCNIEKSFDDFHKSKKNKDGLTPICKKCRSSRKPRPINTTGDKICTTCNIKKLLTEFPKRYKGSYDGHRNECYDCKNIRHIAYKDKNRQKFYEYHKEYSKTWMVNNREKSRDYTKKWTQKNLEKRRKYDTAQRKNNTNYRIKKNLRGRIRSVLKNKWIKKSDKTINLVGCSIEYFVIYLETLFYVRQNGETMTMAKLSTPEIELDHIIPLWKFDLTRPEEQRKAFHYSNIRPLWAEDHQEKSIKDYQEYHAYRRLNSNKKEFLGNCV